MRVNDQPKDDSNKLAIPEQSRPIENNALTKRPEPAKTIHHMPNQQHQEHHSRLEESVRVQLYIIESEEPDKSKS